MAIDAIHLYRSMPKGIQNAVSHVCVLNACSHAGFVQQAQRIFDQISNKTERIITTMVMTLLSMEPCELLMCLD